MIKLLEALRGGRQTLMMKGMPRSRQSLMVKGADGKGLGQLDLDAEEELDELSFTGNELSMHKNPMDTYKFIRDTLNSPKIFSKVKSIRS